MARGNILRQVLHLFAGHKTGARPNQPPPPKILLWTERVDWMLSAVRNITSATSDAYPCRPCFQIVSGHTSGELSSHSFPTVVSSTTKGVVPTPMRVCTSSSILRHQCVRICIHLLHYVPYRRTYWHAKQSLNIGWNKSLYTNFMFCTYVTGEPHP